jgi:hypothetical protein
MNTSVNGDLENKSHETALHLGPILGLSAYVQAPHSDVCNEKRGFTSENQDPPMMMMMISLSRHN